MGFRVYRVLTPRFSIARLRALGLKASWFKLFRLGAFLGERTLCQCRLLQGFRGESLEYSVESLGIKARVLSGLALTAVI